MKFYLFRNLKFLCFRNLKKEMNQPKFVITDEFIDNLVYNLKLNDDMNIPDILDINESIDNLILSHKSCIRFGDGEFQLMLGKKIPFQDYSDKLAKHLFDAIRNNNDKIMTCIPYCAFYPNKKHTDIALNFWKNGYSWRKLMIDNLIKRKKYYASELTLASSHIKQIDEKEYFNKLKQVWENKDIAIICGKTVFEKIDYNIFDNANSVEYMYVPSINAYEKYDTIFKQAKNIDKNKTIFSICGPTATVLCYDLACLGYRAIDIGHIAKTYDWYMKGKDVNNLENSKCFFAPD